jgi:integrase
MIAPKCRQVRFGSSTTSQATKCSTPGASADRGERGIPSHNLEAYLDAYIKAAGVGDDGKAPLFRSAAGRTGALTERPMNRVDAWRMIQRRAADLGTRVRIGCHTFRATGITAYLEAGGTLENAQAMAAHESPRTTKLYDRTGDEITLDEVERITI